MACNKRQTSPYKSTKVQIFWYIIPPPSSKKLDNEWYPFNLASSNFWVCERNPKISIQLKVMVQCFHVLLLITLYKMVLTFQVRRWDPYMYAWIKTVFSCACNKFWGSVWNPGVSIQLTLRHIRNSELYFWFCRSSSRLPLTRIKKKIPDFSLTIHW